MSLYLFNISIAVTETSHSCLLWIANFFFNDANIIALITTFKRHSINNIIIFIIGSNACI